MDSLIIEGGRRLEGSIKVQGSKNALLPIMAATLMHGNTYILENCPRIKDADTMVNIIVSSGGSVAFGDGTLIIDTKNSCCRDIPDTQTRAMRSSIFLLGPCLARFGKVVCVYPGGCAIGARPIDLHIKGLRCLGVDVRECGDKIICEAKNAHAGRVILDFPSVGATENLMMFAASLDGKTEIINAAKEPEIVDLQEFLRKNGVNINGAGTNRISVCGKTDYMKEPLTYRIMSDRIEAGTLMAAAAASKGKIELLDVNAKNNTAVITKLCEMGCKIHISCDTIYIDAQSTVLKAAQPVETAPYPGFPTDMQAILFALCAQAQGTSVIKECIYENRFRHAAELVKMGADVTLCDRTAVIRGRRLHGARVQSKDLRGGAALCIAALGAEGRTVVENADTYIDRGYECIEKRLASLGADVKRIKEG